MLAISWLQKKVYMGTIYFLFIQFLCNGKTKGKLILEVQLMKHTMNIYPGICTHLARSMPTAFYTHVVASEILRPEFSLCLSG